MARTEFKTERSGKEKLQTSRGNLWGKPIRDCLRNLESSKKDLIVDLRSTLKIDQAGATRRDCLLRVAAKIWQKGGRSDKVRDPGEELGCVAALKLLLSDLSIRFGDRAQERKLGGFT